MFEADVNSGHVSAGINTLLLNLTRFYYFIDSLRTDKTNKFDIVKQIVAALLCGKIVKAIKKLAAIYYFLMATVFCLFSVLV